MAEIEGYKTQVEVAELLGVSEPKVRMAIAALGIEAHSLNADRRAKYYSDAEVERIRAWLAEQK
jgi:hypothetical protein